MNESLDQFESGAIQYDYANDGTRFLHHIIDAIVANIFIRWFTNVLFSLDSVQEIFFDLSPSIVAAKVIDAFFALTLYFLFFFMCEWLLKGKTPGKFITKCRAVMEDGSPLTPAAAAIRSICRFIPFDGLSIFWGRIWHDKLSKTAVISH